MVFFCTLKGNIFNSDKQKLVNHLIGYYISQGGKLIKTYRADVMDISCCGSLKPKLSNSFYICE
jgi:hypothetical protein